MKNVVIVSYDSHHNGFWKWRGAAFKVNIIMDNSPPGMSYLYTFETEADVVVFKLVHGHCIL